MNEAESGAAVLLHPVVRRLTRREKEVLKMVALGEPHKSIAATLGISIKTVEKHKQALMDKTGRHCTAALTRLAIAAQMITAE